MNKILADRNEAGQKLAELLLDYKAAENTIVYGLSRGGVIVAAEIAKILQLPLNVVVVKKIPHPAYSEYAIGAIAHNSRPVFNEREKADVSRAWLDYTLLILRKKLEDQYRYYEIEKLNLPSALGKTIILIDDGIATGYTMDVAIREIKKQKPQNIIVAVPVASKEGYNAILGSVDRIIKLLPFREFLGSVGLSYINFEQVEDLEVKEALQTTNELI